MSNSRARLIPGKPTPIRTVPEQIDCPEYVWKDTVQEAMGEPVVQSPEVIEAMREASKIAANALVVAGRAVSTVAVSSRAVERSSPQRLASSPVKSRRSTGV